MRVEFWVHNKNAPGERKVWSGQLNIVPRIGENVEPAGCCSVGVKRVTLMLESEPHYRVELYDWPEDDE